MQGRVVAAICALCVAGCGDNTGATFHVVSISPASGERDVDIESEVVIELSEPIDVDSVDGEAVALEGVAADLAVEGSAIRLVPPAPLP